MSLSWRRQQAFSPSPNLLQLLSSSTLVEVFSIHWNGTIKKKDLLAENVRRMITNYVLRDVSPDFVSGFTLLILLVMINVSMIGIKFDILRPGHRLV